MTEREFIKQLLTQISPQEFDRLLNSQDVDSEFGRKLHQLLGEQDMAAAMSERFQLNQPSVAKPDSLSQAIYRFLARAEENQIKVTEADLYYDCIDKDHYYQIRDGKIKRSKKKKIFFRIAILLRLDYFETAYLLNLGGHIFSPCFSLEDYIIAHCLCTGQYDINEVNRLLTENNLDSLGGMKRRKEEW